MSNWDAWIGREEISRDRIDESAVGRWLATFGRSPLEIDVVPQGFHWCLCLPHAPTAGLGIDGHPLREESETSFLPPVALPRRMWAASQVSFLTPLQPGQNVVRRSRVASLAEKHGSSGLLVFAAIEHETLADGDVAVRETQSVVFREAAVLGTTAPHEPGTGRFDPSGWDAHSVITPSEPLLFRYSALTFNSHRIHYDQPYAIEQEGYRGLVVHGPLTASLLLDLARRHFGLDNALAQFEFRGVSPAIALEELHLVLREQSDAIELAAFASDGRQVMAARARRQG